MAFDGITAYALCQELRQAVTGARIEKIYQPERDELLLQLHTNDGKLRLVLSCNANSPRAHLTNFLKENPISAPMFCMLLRKHLQSGRITSVRDMGAERIIWLDIESQGELGDREKKTLVVEIMGHASNIILLSEDGTILDSMKRVDFTVSTVRQILPGQPYRLPPSQGKADPFATTSSSIRALLEQGLSGRVDKWILQAFEGVSPLFCREVAYRCFGDATVHFEEIGLDDKEKLAELLAELFSLVYRGETQPVVLTDANTAMPFDFSLFPILQYGAEKKLQRCESISAAMDAFYTQKDHAERLTQKKASLRKTLMTLLDRCSKKIVLQEESVRSAQKKKEYKRMGDLLFANLYRIPDGSAYFETEDFYDEDRIVRIEMDPHKSPSQNANLYYAKYTKAKNTEAAASKQLKKSQEEMDYLESVYEALKLAQNETEISEIREELAQNGFLQHTAAPRSGKKQPLTMPLSFTSSDGFSILVGKNNRQNDLLTLKTARNSDLWFHTKNIPGSHTIVFTKGQTEIPERTLIEAAQLCAYHSKAKTSSNVPVDYTTVKNVKKPGGAKPGMVIYDHYKTLYVTPEEALVKRLQAEQ